MPKINDQTSMDCPMTCENCYLVQTKMISEYNREYFGDEEEYRPESKGGHGPGKGPGPGPGKGSGPGGCPESGECPGSGEGHGPGKGPVPGKGLGPGKGPGSGSGLGPGGYGPGTYGPGGGYEPEGGSLYVYLCYDYDPWTHRSYCYYTVAGKDYGAFDAKCVERTGPFVSMRDCDNWIESQGVRRGEHFECSLGSPGGNLYVYLCHHVDPPYCYYTVAYADYVDVFCMQRFGPFSTMQQCDAWIESQGVIRGEPFSCPYGSGNLYVYFCRKSNPSSPGRQYCYYTVAGPDFADASCVRQVVGPFASMRECDRWIESQGARRGETYDC